MSKNLSARMDGLVSELEALPLPHGVVSALEAAADAVAECKPCPVKVQARLSAMASERMDIEAASVLGADRNHGVTLSIAIPSQYAAKFPDPEMFNHGHDPHMTILYVSSEMTMGQASEVLHLSRQVARTIPPFRVFVDAQGGLQTFGDGDNGEKALWLSARSDPRGEEARLHRTLRMILEREGVKVSAHKDFTPHITWAYVENDVSDEAVRRMDNHASDRFPGGFWFDVRHLIMSMPDGSTKAIALSPMPRGSVY